MAEILIFHFQKGNSPIHRMDVPVKLAGLLCFSLLLLPVSAFRLAVLFPCLLLSHKISRIQAGSFLKESHFFLIMGAVIFFSNFFSSGILINGVLKTLRFFLILWAALIFTCTTDPLSVGSGIYRLLKPVPLLPARQVSTTLGLSLTMLPLILDQIREIREAMWSRGALNRFQPVRNMIRLGFPLMEGILNKAECLSDAMESRLFTEEATAPEKTGENRVPPILLYICLISAVLISERIYPSSGKFYLFFRTH